MNLNLRGKIWKYYELDDVKWEDQKQWGLCCGPKQKAKAIVISTEPKELDRLSVIIHEGLHACLWDMDEEAIRETANSIAVMLWRLGYRDK